MPNTENDDALTSKQRAFIMQAVKADRAEDKDNSELTEHQRALVQATVRSTLLSIGLNIESPTEILELQKDFQDLRAWRKAKESAAGKTVLVVIGTLVTGIMAAVLVGIKQLLLPHS